MKRIVTPFAIVCVVIFVIVAVVAVKKDDEAEIKKWADSQGYSIVSCEQTILDIGPFWYRSRHQRTYRVVVKTPSERVIYFRMGYWSYDKEWEQ